MPVESTRDPFPNDECPPPPAHVEDLEFEPYLPMVDWFSPTELARTGVKASLSSLFGAYADQREMQALQGAPDVYDYAQEGPLWVDYVADLGDGFDATYTVARLLAEETLTLEGDHPTRRGRLLVMGGDQVYPTATRETYNDRLVGPYRAALPCVLPAEEAPHLFALPGNHDWYDGLTSFTRLFCQQRWIGGWKTRQTRSYFAARLSRRWWLWGIDVQLHSDIDLPQLEYFEAVARDHMDRDSLIILCCAEPAWVAAARDDVAYEVLAFFEEKTMTPYGHSLVVGLAGDRHTYARYEEQAPEQPLAPKQRFISGGGGAYLYPTHDLPRKLTLSGSPRTAGTTETDTYTLENKEGSGDEACSVFPGIKTSRALAFGSLLFGWRNKRLAFFLGGFYLFFAWIFQNASRAGGNTSYLHLLATGEAGLGDVFGAFLRILAHSPASALLLLLLIAGLVGFADSKTHAGKLTLGLGHALLHVASLPLLMWLFVRVNISVPFVAAVGGFWQVLLFAVEMIVLGGLAAGFVMGLYLLTGNLLWGVHGNEVFLCQRLTSFKNVLRLYLDAEENLAIYPIGIREVCKDWKLHPEASRGMAWFTSETWNRRRNPDAGKRNTLYTLIEGPIRMVLQEKPGDENSRARHGKEGAPTDVQRTREPTA